MNSWPLECHSSALPTELHPRCRCRCARFGHIRQEKFIRFGIFRPDFLFQNGKSIQNGLKRSLFAGFPHETSDVLQLTTLRLKAGKSVVFLKGFAKIRRKGQSRPSDGRHSGERFPHGLQGGAVPFFLRTADAFLLFSAADLIMVSAGHYCCTSGPLSSGLKLALSSISSVSIFSSSHSISARAV